MGEVDSDAAALNALGSLRDPDGYLVAVDGRLLRIIRRSGVAGFNAFMKSKVARKFTADDRIVRTQILETAEWQQMSERPSVKSLLRSEDVGIVVEHERIPFRSFPYEWPPELLYEAGLLTLDLADGLLADNLGLKDATPYNVLFRGPDAVFTDILSFEPREPGDPTWLPYAQFVRTFVLPLLVYKHFGVPLSQVFTTHRDGLEPEDVYKLCGLARRFRLPFLTLVSIPKWLGARGAADGELYQKKVLADPERARFVCHALFRHLRRTLRKVAPPAGRSSTWSGYMASLSHYSEEEFAAKRAFVERALVEFRPRRVLDVGCNTGVFSQIAAKSGAQVISIDYDPVVLGDVWRTARKEKLDIQPLLVDLTRPSPAVGWRNEECPGFLDRARGFFDAVMMLAVVHHMLVSERIPTAEIIDLAAELTTDLLILEFVSPEDPMFRKLTRGRDHLFADLTVEAFENVLQRRFTKVRSQRVSNTHGRWLYLLRKVR